MTIRPEKQDQRETVPLIDTQWKPSRHAPTPATGVIHVWRIPLTATPVKHSERRPVLSADEQSRAMRLRCEHKRAHFIAGRTALRTVLGMYTGIPAGEVVFEYGPSGKPGLEPTMGGDELRFNFTHSQELALLAVSLDLTMGIDTEYRHRRLRVSGLARAIFSPAEASTFSTIAAEQQKDALLAAWTRKEAYLKALGTGLSIPLKSVPVPVEPGSESAVQQLEVDCGQTLPWKFLSLAPHPDYVATLTAPGLRWSVQRFDWSPEEHPVIS